MKQRITVTIDSDSYQLLKSADVNISAPGEQGHAE